MDVLNSPEYESYSDVQSATLMHLYRRLGHQYFEAVIKMAKDPASAIILTDRTRLDRTWPVLKETKLKKLSRRKTREQTHPSM